MRHGRRRPRAVTVLIAVAAVLSAGLVLLPQQAQAVLTAVPAGAAGAASIASALTAPGTTITGATFAQSPASSFTPNGTANSEYAGFPTNGPSFGVLTTGNVTNVGRPNFKASTNDGGLPTAARGATAYDTSVLKVDLDVPAGANCLTFDFTFLSEEYRYYVGGKYNDAFVAELDNSTWTTTGVSTISAPRNFAFDAGGQVVSVNSTGLGGMTAENGAGTAFDYGTDATVNGTLGGATGLLRASTRVTPGAHSVYFSIFDQGDGGIDSAAFLDNLRAGFVADPATNCRPGAQVANDVLTLGPATGTAQIDTAHTVSATVTDTDGNPVPNAPVTFTVTGANSGTGTVSTDPAGTATFTWTGARPGTDSISACYQQTGSPGGSSSCLAAGSATMTWQQRVTVSADSYQISYGAADPAFSWSVAGLDGADALTSQPTCDVAGAHTAPGAYPITCTGAAVDPRYALRYVPGTLTVAPAAVTITADSQTTTYGDPDPAFDYRVAGLIGSETLLTEPTCGVAGPHRAAGSYDITCSGADAGGNYTTSYLAGKLTVKPAAVVVTADNKAKVYGDAEPAYTWTTTGLIGSDHLRTPPTCDVDREHAHVGDYDIACTGADAGGDYTISFVPGTLTVTRAPVVVTADNTTQVFGGAEPAYTWTTTGLVGDVALRTPPTCDVSGAHAAVGNYDIVCTGADAGSDYTLSSVPGTLSVTRAKATITADNKTITYGDADPEFTFTAGGTLGPDTLGSTPTCSVAGPAVDSGAGGHRNAGSYDITCTGPATDGNYEIAYLAGTLTVKKAAVTVTAANRTTFYGDPEPDYGFTATGLIGSDTLTTAPGCGVAGAHRNAGSYDIVCTGASASGNYTVSSLPGTLTVQRVALTITADNKSTVFGGAEPAYTYATTGLVGADSLTSTPTCGVAGSHTAAGSYEITCTGASAGGNYTVGYLRGTLTVARAGTSIRMTPLLFGLFRPTATLTRSDTAAPIANQTVVFSTGSSTVCSAVTSSKGVARCSGTVLITLFVPATATFAGSSNYTGSRDNAYLLST